MNSKLKLTIHGLTDVGLVRDHNEDMVAWDADNGIILLADGMGGHNAGEVASDIAINSVKEAVEEILTPEVLDSCEVDFMDAVKQAIIYANDQINDTARENPKYTGMGTTIVMGLFLNDKVIIANVGDSRIYRFRNGELTQITSDHSLVQEMVDNGYMSEEEAQNSANKNLITRALGIAEDVEVDVEQFDLEDNDIYLFCSDGLSDMVQNEQIFATLVKGRDDLDRASNELVELAKVNGGYDNISVILAAYQ